MSWRFLKSEQQIENRLLYGFYPDVINNQGKGSIETTQL